MKYPLTILLTTLALSFNVIAADSKPVEVVNIPLVEVVNEVPVTIENIPLVEVVNEVPVSAPVLQPVMFSSLGEFGPSDNTLIETFEVEEGKTLLIEQVSNTCSSNGAIGSRVIGRSTVGNRYGGLYLTFEDTGLTRFRDSRYSNHAVTYYVQGGDELEVAYLSQDFEEAVCQTSVIGRYIEAAP
jgi:hypothetical protein